MLVPLSWLKDYIDDLPKDPMRIAQELTDIGFEVEGVDDQANAVNNVVVGKINAVDPHPKADRLKVLRVLTGRKDICVITNVADVKVGDLVAVALIGAKLKNGLVITRTNIRGINSEGMLCGLEELGLDELQAPGQKMGDIIRYEDATIGENALVALGRNDVVFDVNVLANRPDCNSIYGIAKEVGVAFKLPVKAPHIHYEAKRRKNGDVKYNIQNMIGVKVFNSDLCPRYMAAGVKNVKITESPEIIKKRLSIYGIRPINNIVDITNYVLIETGQPMHAFDRSKIAGKKIIVRNAEEGEQIVTLDGKTNTLNDSMLVICDSEKPMAVAGIMGGEQSGITMNTEEIVFESAKFARDNIRRTSRKLNLRSDSSARFEKGISFSSQQLGIERALTLIYESGAGEIVDGMIDVCVDYEKERTITFTSEQIKNIVACPVNKARLINNLNPIGLDITVDGKMYTAHIPEERGDIVGVNDIAEEFIRVAGFFEVVPTYFKNASLLKGGVTVPESIRIADRIKDSLVGYGLNECITYSFTSPEFADKLHLYEEDIRREYIKIINPIGAAMSAMRTTLTHSMLETLAYNRTHFVDDARLFEVARVYLPNSLPLTELPNEREKVVIGAYGEGVDYYYVKGAVEEMFKALNIKDVMYIRSDEPFLHPGRSAEVRVNGYSAGYIGEVHPDIAKAYGIDNVRAYIAEFYIDKLTAKNTLANPHFEQFTHFPSVERDLAIVLDDDVAAQDIIRTVAQLPLTFYCGQKIFDVYKGEQIGEGKKSVAIRYYFSSLERTLKDEEVNKEMDAILAALETQLGAKIR